MSIKEEYLVTQTAHFTFRVKAESAEEAEMLASQLDYDSAWESYAEPVNPKDIIIAEEQVL